MITVNEAILKMTDDGSCTPHDVQHFLKVWAYARLIGMQEGLDERTQKTLEFAAIVHDIACPSLRREHGSAPGHLQEIAGPPLVHDFYKGSGLDPEMIERISFLVGHHHSYSDVDGPDWQILLEADYLVNADESHAALEEIRKFKEKVFRTGTGKKLLDQIYGIREG